MYRGREKYPGKITRDRGDGTYCVRRRARDEGRGASIKKDGGGGSDSFREGDKIEADYRGRGKFYPAKFRDRGDDTYDIDYHDGEGNARLKRLIRSKDGVFGSSDKLEEATRWRRAIAAARSITLGKSLDRCHDLRH